ncbi:MAG: Aspartate carbamoyltransferase regulatory chain [Chlamydiia bacterium]|nr:Aspartate carbamoyltransferase regulatory chain [Chlamydiia bacterium]
MKLIDKDKQYQVAALMNGSVIDHIPSGLGGKIIELLSLNTYKKPIVLGKNLKSQRLGFKDLIKIDGIFLSPEDAYKVALFAPKATISIIKSYQVEEKLKARLPSTIEEILVCPNPKCITRHENAKTKFLVKQQKENIYLSCCYCQKDFLIDEVKEYSR